MTPIRRTLVALAAAITASLALSSAHADAIRPRPDAVKPGNAIVQPWHDQTRICVKFKDDSKVRLDAGALANLGDARDAMENALAPFNGGAWKRLFAMDDAKLDGFRTKARGALRKETADLTSYFEFTLPAGVDPAQAIDALNALDMVELAQPMPTPAPPPVPGNFVPGQGYAMNPPSGTDAFDAWTAFGFRGEGIKICDVEYDWNNNHEDLPNVTRIGPIGQDPFGNNHGTAVIGEMASLDNGYGTTGMAPDAEYFFAHALVGSYNPGAAIIRALDVLGPGDAILIEQQITGPNGGDNFVPIEWFRPYYDAIVTATGQGVTVVQAAGNGGQNLDAPEFQTGNGGHYPFLLENDSGAIIVGAGSSGGRTRLGFSCYGATVDLQGWGQNVTTTGYGGLYSAEGQNLWYTSTFSGTSSASPIVTASVALVQSAYMNLTGVPLTPMEVRGALRATGTPQAGNTNENIGPLPNVPAAIEAALGDAQALLPLEDHFDASGSLDTLNWPTSNNAFVTQNAIGEPSGANALELRAGGTVLSARLQARLFDDITITYNHQMLGDASLRVEWLNDSGQFVNIATHNNNGAAVGPFQFNSYALPVGTAHDGLRIRITNDGPVPFVDTAFVDDVLVTGVPALPRPFGVNSPVDGATEVATNAVYLWEPSDLSDSYRIVVDDDEDFSSPLIDTVTFSTFYSNPGIPLAQGTQYFWKVEAINANGFRLGDPGVQTFFTVGFELECPGDCNGNGTVDFNDLVCLIFRFGNTTDPIERDCDGSGTVNFADLVCALFNFGPCPG